MRYLYLGEDHHTYSEQERHMEWCQECKFYYPDEDSKSSLGHCRLYPEQITTEITHWCGQFKEMLVSVADD